MGQDQGCGALGSYVVARSDLLIIEGRSEGLKEDVRIGNEIFMLPETFFHAVSGNRTLKCFCEMLETHISFYFACMLQESYCFYSCAACVSLYLCVLCVRKCKVYAFACQGSCYSACSPWSRMKSTRRQRALFRSMKRSKELCALYLRNALKI